MADTFTLSPLPYAKDALEPHISATTVDVHYEKHHRGYVNKLNALVLGRSALASKSLEELVKTEHDTVFNLAAQIWNHTFYWNGLVAASHSGHPSAALLKAIEADFSSFDQFKAKFTKLAVDHFGSGWVWLVKDTEGKLKVVDTHDAANPLTNSQIPLLTLDVWEHAYYIDKKSDRASYISAWWNVVNWQEVSERFQKV